MVYKEIYEKCIGKLTKYHILCQSKRNNEKPFGYVIDYIKDVYEISKTEGWDTAKKICEYFGL